MSLRANPAPTLHPNTSIGYVHLTVSNLDRLLAFYQDVLGFQLRERTGDTARLGAGAAQDLLVLTENRNATPARGTTGLYHFAILVPSRFELARSLRRLAELRTPLQGFADHLVSEAIYLADPDGNRIEIYRDRPRSEWPFQNGRLQMTNAPLDTTGLLAELAHETEPWVGLHPQTVIGHVHLHVADLAKAETFYAGVLGFTLMQHYGTAAAFVSAGGYHHHLGLNTWAGVGAPPPPPEATGLRYFTIRLPNATELAHVVDRVRQAGVAIEETPAGLLIRDPSYNGVMLTV